MTEQLTIMTDEYAKEFNKKHSKKPCDTPCEKKPMMGRSWWKSLGYGTPCLCAENAYDEQEKAKKKEYTCDCQECGETIELEKYETPEEQKIWFDMEDEIKLCDECAKDEENLNKKYMEEAAILKGFKGAISALKISLED